MKFYFLVILLIYLSFILTVETNSEDDENFSSPGEEEEIDITKVTCGSIIKLRNLQYNTRLHSHKITYGSGSGQQSVTGMTDKDDSNSLWIIRGPHKKFCSPRKVIKNGDIIRLQHLNTLKNLHSHLHQSPLSNKQEVSAFGEDGDGDTGDNWKVIILDGNEEWKRNSVIRLQHVDTEKFLATTNYKFGNPIPGQNEICAVSSLNKEIEWITEEGFYFSPKK
jgi:dolichyl-phosphate-mannose--protein O-mannosyl transferase